MMHNYTEEEEKRENLNENECDSFFMYSCN